MDTNVLLFQSFTRPQREVSIPEVATILRSDQLRSAVERIRSLARQGESEQVTQLKAKLPKVAFSAHYSEARRPECFTRYSYLVMIDIDHVSPEKLEEIIRQARRDRHLRLGFVSPRGEGYKLLYPVESLTPLEGYTQVCRFHGEAFLRVSRYVTTRYGVAPDPSGKDLGRLCYLSHDPQCHYSPKAKGFTIEPQKEEEKRKRQDEKRTRLLSNAEKVVKRYEKKQHYEEGNRNNFVYGLACELNRAGISPDDTLTLLAPRYPDLPTPELRHAVESAYSHAEEHNSRPVSNRKRLKMTLLKEELGKNYDFRRNLISEQIEWREKEEPHFRLLDDMSENTLWCRLQEKDIACSLAHMQALLNSDFTPEYNPFAHYFEHLPAWDGHDHIADLARCMLTDTPDLWLLCLRKWLVGMVATALDDHVTNHAVIILSNQGIGKSRFCKRLLPDELKGYFSNGMIDPENKDDLMRLTRNLLINLDDIEMVSEKKLGRLKSLITSESISLRMIYQRHLREIPHRASFIASSNHRKVLTDITGNRRFLCFEAQSFDHSRPIDHTALYAQAYHLYRQGFAYWFTAEEEVEIDRMNERFRELPPEEELLKTYFRKPRHEDAVIYCSCSEIASKLAFKSGLGSHAINIVHLGRVIRLEEYESILRNGRTVYKLHEIPLEEVEQERKRKETPGHE